MDHRGTCWHIYVHTIIQPGAWSVSDNIGLFLMPLPRHGPAGPAGPTEVIPEFAPAMPKIMGQSGLGCETSFGDVPEMVSSKRGWLENPWTKWCVVFLMGKIIYKWEKHRKHL